MKTSDVLVISKISAALAARCRKRGLPLWEPALVAFSRTRGVVKLYADQLRASQQPERTLPQQQWDFCVEEVLRG